MKKRTIPQLSEQISVPLQAIAAPQRIAILLAIGQGEACVCHLEAVLGWRQAYISQHLMALRRADILKDRREGRYVYYSLKNSSYLELIMTAAEAGGVPAATGALLTNTQSYPSCECPHCSPAFIAINDLNVKTAP